MYRLECVGYLKSKTYNVETIDEARDAFKVARAYRYTESSFEKEYACKLTYWWLYKDGALIKSGTFGKNE